MIPPMQGGKENLLPWGCKVITLPPCNQPAYLCDCLSVCVSICLLICLSVHLSFKSNGTHGLK